MQLITVDIATEQDVVLARQRARQIGALLGFDPQDQARIATAVSEIARNAYKYAGGGRVEFSLEGKTAPQIFTLKISDKGKGIPNLDRILDGKYESKTGMGIGITGSRRLVDQMDISTDPQHGTTVTLKKLVPKTAPVRTSSNIGRLMDELARIRGQNPYEEIQLQNQELLRTLQELRGRQDELTRLNHELEDTNRGVLALYAELDEKADHLRRADELKTKFLSNMSHEFRTPLNSINALCRILLDRMDGPLTSEQEKQINFIQKGSNELLVLVNDLLDLAKIEAGKTVIRPTEFEVGNLFSALRGMLRPLLVSQSVNLIFEEPVGLPTMNTDEGKVSQILRNFISNALKFTERGEVRVQAVLSEDESAVIFSVSDTGIGIAEADRDKIFKEFGQLEHRIQNKVKGTGLGLPLSKKLAELMGGSVSVVSTLGQGSTFTASIPIVYKDPSGGEPSGERDVTLAPGKKPVLIVEDDDETRFIYEKVLQRTEFHPVSVSSVAAARRALRQFKPIAVVLDVMMPGDDTWQFLTELKSGALARMPVIMATTVEDEQKGLSLGADEYFVKPLNFDRLLEQLRQLTTRHREKSALIVDDDEGFRYALASYIKRQDFAIEEAGDGESALKLIQERTFDVIFLDVVMPGAGGLATLEELRKLPQTAASRVVIVTSKRLTDHEQQIVRANHAIYASKSSPVEETVRSALSETSLQPVDGSTNSPP